MSDNGYDDDYFNETFGLQHEANSEKTPNMKRMIMKMKLIPY